MFLDRSFVGTRFLLLALLAGALVLADMRWQPFEPARGALLTLVTPVHAVTHWPFALARHVAELYRVQDENRALREQLLKLSTESQRARALQQENTRLRELLGATESLAEIRLLAEVIGASPNPRFRSLVLDRGARDGVEEGQPVVDRSGLMGQVVVVGRTASRLLLVTDPDHITPVMVARNEYRAMLQGAGASAPLELRHVPETADVREGDLLVTSGLDQRFPSGYPVARVVKVAQVSGEPFLEIHARPLARLQRSRQLALLQKPVVLPLPNGKQP